MIKGTSAFLSEMVLLTNVSFSKIHSSSSLNFSWSYFSFPHIFLAIFISYCFKSFAVSRESIISLDPSPPSLLLYCVPNRAAKNKQKQKQKTEHVCLDCVYYKKKSRITY